MRVMTLQPGDGDAPLQSVNNNVAAFSSATGMVHAEAQGQMPNNNTTVGPAGLHNDEALNRQLRASHNEGHIG